MRNSRRAHTQKHRPYRGTGHRDLRALDHGLRLVAMMALVVALAGMGEGHLGSPTPASPTCALDQSRACPLPPWPSTYNLSQSSIMYQPWCGAGGAREPGCSTFLNVSWWWTQPSKLDPGSTGPGSTTGTAGTTGTAALVAQGGHCCTETD